jgi:hypothetical protein
LASHVYYQWHTCVWSDIFSWQVIQIPLFDFTVLLRKILVLFFFKEEGFFWGGRVFFAFVFDGTEAWTGSYHVKR